MERNLLLTIRFDGSKYCGWQVQKNGPTIMEALQNAMEIVLKERPDVKGCSRTDSKVHAESYCVSFKTKNKIPVDRVVTAFNCNLPDEIAAVDCCEVPDDFHARYNAKAKLYTYKVYNAPIRDPFWATRAMFLPISVSHESIKREAAAFLGTHDFSAFCNAGGTTVDNVRTIYYFDAKRDGDVLSLSVCGNGFLYNMVRIMMGTLLNIETGILPHNSIEEILKSKDRKNAGLTAPPHGLYLSRVFYDDKFKKLQSGVLSFEKDNGI